jgi:hypothetical protein
MWDAICRRDDEHQRIKEAEADLADEFAKAIAAGDPDATPAWAGTVTDYEAARKLGMSYSDKGVPRRAYTVGECLRDALEYSKGPDMGDVQKLLALASNSTDATVAQAAKQLVQRAAVVWASNNFDSEAV